MTCPLTPELPALLERSDEAALERLVHHAGSCPDCRAEIERSLATKPEGTARRLLSDFATGLGVIGTIAVLIGIRGVTNAINQRLYDMGMKPAPWFKPKEKR